MGPFRCRLVTGRYSVPVGCPFGAHRSVINGTRPQRRTGQARYPHHPRPPLQRRYVAVAVDALEPQFRHFALLKTQLAHYRALANEDGLTDLPALPAKSL